MGRLRSSLRHDGFDRLAYGQEASNTSTAVRRKKGAKMAEQHTEQSIKVRQVTDVQVSWTESGRGEHGAFTVQLILDSGAEEYVLQPTAEDTKIMVELFKLTDKIFFDVSRQVLIFGDVPIGR